MKARHEAENEAKRAEEEQKRREEEERYLRDLEESAEAQRRRQERERALYKQDEPLKPILHNPDPMSKPANKHVKFAEGTA